MTCYLVRDFLTTLSHNWTPSLSHLRLRCKIELLRRKKRSLVLYPDPNAETQHVWYQLLEIGKGWPKAPLRSCLLEKPHLIKINTKKTKLCNIKSTKSVADQSKLLDLSEILQNKWDYQVLSLLFLHMPS